MLWDKLSCFSFVGRKTENGKNPLPVAASGSKDSMVIDTKLNRGVFDEHLRIFGMYTGAKLTAGTVTTEVQTCDTVAGSYEKIAEATHNGNVLIDIPFPRNAKRFVKLVYKVGTTALNRTIDIMAGLLPETEVTEALKLQNLNVVAGGVNKGPEDLTVDHATLV